MLFLGYGAATGEGVTQHFWSGTFLEEKGQQRVERCNVEGVQW
jgi:hypothetical protein